MNEQALILSLYYLDDMTLLSACQSNKKIYQRVCNNIWLGRIRTKFPYLSLDILNKYKGDRSWSEYYLNDLRKISGTDKDLMSSLYNDRFDHFMVVVNNGGNIHYVDKYGNPILIEALSLERPDIAMELIKMGADINQENTQKTTPLIEAIQNGYVDIVKVLISKGSNVDQRTLNDIIPLIWASSAGKLEMVKELLAGGANINILNRDGYNALMSASGAGHLNVVKELSWSRS